MTLKKTILTATGTAVLLLSLPVAAVAADSVSLTTPKAGDTSLQVAYTNGKTTDNYFITVNSSSVANGSLTQVGNQKVSYDLNRSLAVGDVVTYFVTGPQGTYTSYKAVVGEAVTPKAPTAMTLSATSVKPAKDANVLVNFNKDYVPHQNDSLKVTRYDAQNKVLASYDVALPDTYDGPITVALSDSEATSYYTLEFVAGDGSAAGLTPARVNVGDATAEQPTTNEITAEQKAALENAKDITFSYPSNAISLGDSVVPTINILTNDGKTVAYTGPVSFSYSGAAVADGSFESNGRFSVASDSSLVGSKVQVTAMVGKFVKTVELTVQASDKALPLTPDTIAVGTNQRVAFQVANSKGTRLHLLWQPTLAKVVVKPLDDVNAHIIGTVIDMSEVSTAGTGTIILNSDKATRAEVYVIFSDNQGHLFESGHSVVTFSTKVQAAKKTVELYINSKDYTVDGTKKTSDSAAIIVNDRTFVPFRLLAEAFGAEVKWDEKTNTVTTSLNGHVIVMKIGSTSYTIDGKQDKMDVAPYINKENRTMVPVRFLAEGLGSTVVPHYSSKGTTESVTFTSN